MEEVSKLVDTLGKPEGSTRLISIFMRRRVQPLQARDHAMWDYSGPEDTTRFGRESYSSTELDTAVKHIIKGKKDDVLPGPPSIAPYGEGKELPQVTYSHL